MRRFPRPAGGPSPRRFRPTFAPRRATGGPLETLESRTLFAAGDLDPSFAGDGTALAPFPAAATGQTILVQPDQKILVGGSTGDGLSNDFALVRYNPDGSLDATFGAGGVDGDGKVTTDFGDFDSIEALALTTDNKIVAVGSTGTGSGADWAIARYNANGSIDTTFGGGDGKVTEAFFSGNDVAYGVAVQSDGRIVVTGVATGSTSQIAVERFLVNGDVDTTFGTSGGRTVVDFFGGVDFASEVKIQPADGKIVVVGGSVPVGPGQYRRFVLVRLNPNGQLDSTFGDLGKATADFGGTAFGKDFVIDTAGNYVVGGLVNAPGGADTTDFAVARFLPNGTLDTSFGAGGRTVVTDFAGITNGHYGLAMQSDGKLVLGGQHAAGGFAMARFNANGTLDTSFGAGGTVRTGPPALNGARGSDLALQSDGKIVMSGESLGTTADTQVTVARYVNTITQPASISGTVFDDLNGNGVRDAGEPGMSGVTVYQDVNANGAFDPAQATLPSTDVPKQILDRQAVTSNLTVAGLVGEILDVNVRLSIEHTYDPDLTVTLISPANTRVELFSNVGQTPGPTGNANFQDTTLDDQAIQAITAGRPPFPGEYRPEQALAALIGQNPNGVWQLEVRDGFDDDTGTLQAWSLAITTRGEPSVVTAADGSYSFANVAPGTYRVRQVVQQGYAQTAPTADNGTYVLNVTEGQSVTGRDFGQTAAGTAVVGRHVFYNNSAFDGRTPGIDSTRDAAAIATDKRALLPGQTGSFANVTGFTSGINGIMVDIRQMSGTPQLTFRMGNGGDPSTWVAAPQAQINLANTNVPGLPAGATRVTAVWPDGAIRNTWLQVTVGQSAGLSRPDVFYFGNLVGETTGPTGPSAAMQVTSADVMATARNSPSSRAAVTNLYDHDRDGRVNGLDVWAARRNSTRTLAALTAPAAPAAAAALFGEAPVTVTLSLRERRLSAARALIA